MARPSKYDPAMCEQVIVMGAEGKSLTQMAAGLGITRETLHQWEKDASKPEFSDALTHAREASQAWWEEQNRLGLWNRDFNAQAFKVAVQARFPNDYRDKSAVEITGKDGGAIETRELSDIEAARRIAFTLAKAIKGGE
jgi:transcriptional regulator with XRE-family HTH domain